MGIVENSLELELVVTVIVTRGPYGLGDGRLASVGRISIPSLYGALLLSNKLFILEALVSFLPLVQLCFQLIAEVRTNNFLIRQRNVGTRERGDATAGRGTDFILTEDTTTSIAVGLDVRGLDPLILRLSQPTLRAFL